MKKSKLGIMATALSALILSMSASASDLGTSAVGPGPGGGEGGTPVGGGESCWFAYHIRKEGPHQACEGDKIRYKIFLSNVGNCRLKRIRVTDFLPRRTELEYANPRPSWKKDDKLVWDDVSLRPGDKEVFDVVVKTRHGDCDRRIVNTGCAFTPWIGTRICDSAVTWIKENDGGPGNPSDGNPPSLPERP